MIHLTFRPGGGTTCETHSEMHDVNDFPFRFYAIWAIRALSAAVHYSAITTWEPHGNLSS